MVIIISIWWKSAKKTYLSGQTEMNPENRNIELFCRALNKHQVGSPETSENKWHKRSCRSHYFHFTMDTYSNLTQGIATSVVRQCIRMREINRIVDLCVTFKSQRIWKYCIHGKTIPYLWTHAQPIGSGAHLWGGWLQLAGGCQWKPELASLAQEGRHI